MVIVVPADPAGIVSGWFSQRRVEPSMSVNRKVTTPSGRPIEQDYRDNGCTGRNRIAMSVPYGHAYHSFDSAQEEP